MVTGKGGVGKTTVAAALALVAAARGKRTLVCELDARGDLAAALGAGPLGFEAHPVVAGVWALAVDTESSLREYLALQLRLPLLTRLGPLARAFDFVATVAPGVREVLTIGKPSWEARRGVWDLVVVDAAASGHVASQLDAPRAIGEVVQVGALRHQAGWMRAMLADPAATGAVVVAAPEEVAVAEAVDLLDRLRTGTEVDVAAVVVDRVRPELFGRREEAAFAHLRGPEALDVLADRAGPGVGAVLDAAATSVAARRRRAAHLAGLHAAVPDGVPVLHLPERFSGAEGLSASRETAAALAEELGG